MMSADAYQTIWTAVYILIMVPIVLGNGLIIISIIKYRRLRSKMHILIGNLAVSDFIVGVILIPYSLLTAGQTVHSDRLLCFGKLALFVLCIGSSCFNLTLISLERFVAIVFPLKCKMHFTTFRMNILIAIGWILTLVNSTLPLYGWNEFDVNNTECVSDTLWSPGYKNMVNWEVIICLIFSFILYITVIKIALRRAFQRTHITAGLRHTANIDKDVHQLLTMVIVLGMFALCWFPYVCVAVVVTFYETPSLQFIRRCTLIPGLLNSAVNWLIYGYRNKDFSQAFKSILTFQPSSTRESGVFTLETSS